MTWMWCTVAVDKRQAVESALRRKAGIDDATARQALQHFEQQSDLFTRCPQCKKQLRGTRAELMAHRCEDAS